MRTELKHYVRFYYRGSFVDERSERPIDDLSVEFDMPDGAYAYDLLTRETTFIDTEIGEIEHETKTVYESGRHYPGGEVFTIEEVERKVPGNRILLGNMRGNGFDRVVRSRHGNFQPFNEGDVVY